MDLGITDLRKMPEILPPLRLGVVQVRLLHNYVVQSILKAGSSSESILSAFSPDRPVWEIPSAFAESAPKGCQGVACGAASVNDETQTLKVYADLLKKVVNNGMTPEVRRWLVKHVGVLALHPYVFTTTKKGSKAAGLAAAEFALLVASHSWQTNFHKSYAFVKLKSQSFGSRMGVIDGQVIGNKAKLDPDYLETKLYGERGLVVYGTFDVYDRLRIWTDDNWFALPEPEHFRRALAFLKMMQSPELAYEFEQRLFFLEDTLVSDVSMKTAIYTDEALDELRNIWFTGTDSDEARFKTLYLALVPRFIDAEQFLKMFKLDPSATLNTKEITTINSGMEAFIDHFLAVQIASRKGKVVI